MKKTPDDILSKINKLEKQLSELISLKEKNKFYCCSDLCLTFKSELNSIETQMIEIDKLAYKRFPLFVKYFAETKLKKGMTLEEYTKAVYKNPKDRLLLITHIHKQKKAKEILDKKEILNDILSQIKNNNICRCEK